MRSLVTCVIPTRNRAPLLTRALESVAGQSYSELSVVVVNDASTDATETVVCSFINRLGEQRLRYVRNPNPLGAAEARNIGIATVESPYVAFLDDDDEWLPNKVEAQMQYISEYSLVGTRIRAIRSGSGLSMRAVKRWYQRHTEPEYSLIAGEDLLVSNCGMSPSSVLAATEKVRNIGGFDESLAANQGRDFLIRFGLEFGPLLRLNRRLVLQHQEHDLGRISEMGDLRFEAMEQVHDRYRSRMPLWLRRYDRARISLLKARLASGEDRRRLEKQAVDSFQLSHPLRFLRLYLAYLRDRVR